MKITVDQIMQWGSCPGYTRERVAELIGDSATPEQIAKLDIRADDRIWVLIHAMTGPQQREAACQFTERVPPVFEREYPDDRRPRVAIEAAQAYASGEIDAYGVAIAVAEAGVAGTSARAAWDAETKAQIAIILDILN